MEKDLYIIHKDALPPYFDNVVKAKYKVEHDKKSVSDVCKELNISRSTYYKYKDKVFELVEDYGRKAIFSFKAENEKGVLSGILNAIANYQGNILTINQDMPIHNMGYITIMIDSKDLTVSIYELLDKLKKIPKVRDVSLIAFE